MTRSYLAAIGTVILAVLISCPGASAQGVQVPPVMPPTILPKDQDRLACEASLQAYDEQGCDKNCSDECKLIGSDLSECKNVGNHAAITCKQ